MSKLPELISETVKYDIDSVSALAAALESHAYAQDHMRECPRFADRFHLLDYAISRVALDGPMLEFGVNAGATLNFIAGKCPHSTVVGFDSFEGLPEAWAGAPAGTFAQSKLPSVPDNVQLVVGWFDRTLPSFVESLQSKKIALLHIDCDLYSSTQTVLMQLRHSIVSKTIIVFDEYFNYPQWRQHEYLAFKEFIFSSGLKYEYIGLSPKFEHVAVRIL